MRVAIIGCGSIGLLWATRLLKLGYDVSLFTRTEEQRDCLNANGITFISDESEREQYLVQAHVTVSNPTTEGPFNIVFVTVKQVHLCNLLPFIQLLTGPDSQIIFVQNGLGHEEKIKCLCDRRWTYALISTEGALRKGLTEVQFTGRGHNWIGRFPEDTTFHPLMDQFIQSIHRLVQCELIQDDKIFEKMWGKLLINCVINPLTAIHKVQNGELNSVKYDKEVNLVISEVLQVAQKVGFSFCEKEVRKNIADVCRRTSKNYSSTFQDIQRGLPTEIQYLNGALIRWGKKVNVKTPFNEKLLMQVEKLEGRNEDQRSSSFWAEQMG